MLISACICDNGVFILQVYEFLALEMPEKVDAALHSEVSERMRERE
jgi:hypothetical protein